MLKIKILTIKGKKGELEKREGRMSKGEIKEKKQGNMGIGIG